ncbi:aspartyl protease family protein At5g10770-like [Wolffia australiana]
MATLLSFPIVLLLFFGVRAHGESAFFSVSVSSLVSSPNCTASEGPREGSLPVVHRRGPCSTKPDRRLSRLEALAQDTLRVSSLQEIAAGESRKNDTSLLGSQLAIPTRSGAYIGTGNYVVTVGFGTPIRSQTVIFDTGSDVNWIKCKPCKTRCYRQADPLFNPALSSTYRLIGCASPACRGLRSGGCSRSKCTYGVSYGDGSSTVGFLSKDSLSLAPTKVFKNFVFGCGQNNQGLFGGASGLVGLGRSPYSLNSQVGSNVFSYCIPSTRSSTGYLNMGSPLQRDVVYTPLRTNPNLPFFYFVDLIGITVGSTKLSIPLKVFRSAGTIIDSGTVITRLPPAAYVALRSVFRAAMVSYPLAPAVGSLDTCYDFRRLGPVKAPVIKLHYVGVVVTLPAVGVFYVVSPSQVCLAFAGNPTSVDLGIIGNVQQKTFEVTHDNVRNRIGFSGRGCR